MSRQRTRVLTELSLNAHPAPVAWFVVGDCCLRQIIHSNPRFLRHENLAHLQGLQAAGGATVTGVEAQAAFIAFHGFGDTAEFDQFQEMLHKSTEN